MIKNIPNKYTQKMLLQKINENHKDRYDFFYLPIDVKVIYILVSYYKYRINVMSVMLSLILLILFLSLSSSKNLMVKSGNALTVKKSVN